MAARIQPVAPISKPRFPCAHKAILETFVSNLNLCSKTHTHRGIPVQGGQIGYQMLLAVKQCLNTGSRKNHTRQRQQKKREETLGLLRFWCQPLGAETRSSRFTGYSTLSCVVVG